jgi:hypothetical protein
MKRYKKYPALLSKYNEMLTKMIDSIFAPLSVVLFARQPVEPVKNKIRCFSNFIEPSGTTG